MSASAYTPAVSIGELLGGRAGLRINDPRQTSVSVHAYLRDLIISGALPPGTQLKQAELARVLAVSRTPLREAFRMLQEEGLISSEPNQRSHVLGLDAEELDSLYAARITLESLGARLTAGRLSREEIRGATSAFKEMERTYRAGDMASWTVAHRGFHRLLVGRCGATVLRTINSYAEQSERYVRIDQAQHRTDFGATAAGAPGDLRRRARRRPRRRGRRDGAPPRRHGPARGRRPRPGPRHPVRRRGAGAAARAGVSDPDSAGRSAPTG